MRARWLLCCSASVLCHVLVGAAWLAVPRRVSEGVSGQAIRLVFESQLAELESVESLLNPEEDTALKPKEEPFNPPLIDSQPEPVASPTELTLGDQSVAEPIQESLVSAVESAPVEAAVETITARFVEAAAALEPATISPRYKFSPPPRYPPEARRNRQQGTVMLTLRVLPDGHAAEIHVSRSSGFTLLDMAALKAVRKWIFEPGSEKGMALSAVVEVPVRFELH